MSLESSNPEGNKDSQSKAARYAELARAMRAHWQREADAEARGDPAATARREKERGDHLFNELIEAIKGSLCHLSNAYLHDRGLIEDGMRELMVEMYQKLRDLSGSPSAQNWENPKAFWTCLKRTASNLFLRHVQRDYGRELTEKPAEAKDKEEQGEHGDEAAAVETVRRPGRAVIEARQSELLGAPGAEGANRDRVADAPDPDAENPLRALLDDDALGSLLAAIPDERHRLALLLDVRDMPHEEIARRLGVKSVKTVYNYIERAKQGAFAWAKQRYEMHGEFGDWLGGSGRGGSGNGAASTAGSLPDSATAKYRKGL